MKSIQKSPLIMAVLLSASCLGQTGNTSQGLAICHDKFLGNIMPSSWSGPVVRDDFEDYWNQVTPENAGKWGVVEGSRDNYNWSDLDEIYNYTRDRNIPFKHHVFVWGSQQPSWMEGLSTQEQLEELEEWYALCAQRYPGTEMIDVVNESIRNHAPDLHFVDAIGGFNNGASNAYLAANVDKYGPYGTGWDYIIWSFAKARDYFPDAELHLNDYGIINDPTAIAEHLEIVEILKDRGLIDAVGIQCHQFNVDNLSAASIENNLDLLAQAGLPIYVAELDITGTTEAQQRDRYAEKFPVFWEHEAVAGVTIWGYVEGSTWIDNTGLLNSDGTEKLSMIWLKEYMSCEQQQPECPELVAAPDTVCVEGHAALTVSGGQGPYYWYTELEATEMFDEGASITPYVNQHTTLYVTDRNGLFDGTAPLGLADLPDGIGTWGIDDFETNDKQLVIDVDQTLTIDHVHVYVINAGTDVTIRIHDLNGNFIGQGQVESAAAGKVMVELGVELEKGGYLMDAVGTTGMLTYQNEGGNFPYEIEDVISFTANASWAVDGGRYGMYFDWEVSYTEAEVCERLPVEVVVQDVQQCGVITGEQTVEQATLYAYPNPATSQLTVYSPDKGKYVMVDSLGQIVLQGRFKAGNNVVQTADLANGIYHLQTDGRSIRVNVQGQ